MRVARGVRSDAIPGWFLSTAQWPIPTWTPQASALTPKHATNAAGVLDPHAARTPPETRSANNALPAWKAAESTAGKARLGRLWLLPTATAIAKHGATATAHTASDWILVEGAPSSAATIAVDTHSNGTVHAWSQRFNGWPWCAA